MIHSEIIEAEARAVESERRRCLSIVLGAFAVAQMLGEDGFARVLDRLVTQIEHPEMMDELARES